ncbi:mucolipin-3-like [Contarinia nasturtii]|uniref:mucolipin-3-like n=1 Tax=Contarinia nasturtii TaxID=265458 RepID=UPI0012D489FD|nr:mucolipin-3-like [Contarinia nasturtii]XP_031629742.1 mucolipin-3-like [Contarinia nasturtii]XP_031629743.1 mucolipin-3-like [Contarinia nasturtii]
MSNITPEHYCANLDCDSDDDYDNNNDKEGYNEMNTVDNKQQASDKCNVINPNSVVVNQRRQKMASDYPSTNQLGLDKTMNDNITNQRKSYNHVNNTATSTTEEISFTGVPTSSSQPSASSSSSQLSPMSAFNEDRMRRKLQFFFMNPIEKWQARRKFPYKFVVQLIKIVLLTMQLCLFAHSRYIHVNYTWDNRVSFSHLFLRGWDDTSEVESYPAAKGPFALYFQDEFYDTIDYAVAGYKNLSRSIGSYSYPTQDNTMPPLKLCIHHYEEGEIYGFNESYTFNPIINVICTNLTSNLTDSRTYLADKGIDIKFSAFVQATLDFSIKTVNLKAAGPIAPPDCYQFDIEILFDNSDHDGQMLLSLDAEPIRLQCHGDALYKTDTAIDRALRSLLNGFVILICVASFSLCTRALYRARLLQKQTDTFFRVTYGTPLSSDDCWQFVNFWYIMIICNDILLILGSILKEQIERENFFNDQWDICSVFLGVGNMLVWFGVLRYFSFFKTYNVVILTLKQSAPKILRFLLCALMIYAGFTFCGWLVLAPYHIKFRSLATTSECLFSLINGDDMFATFSIMSTKSQLLWWFSRIYLYSFIGLFIYVVISLFIAVIMDAYDTIKKFYKDGFPNSELKRFIGQMHPNDFSSGIFRTYADEEEQQSIWDTMKTVCYLCCGLKRKENPGPTGYETLVTS